MNTRIQGAMRRVCRGRGASPPYGVDIITCDADGRIVEFRVMLRPLQAVNMMHEPMKALLERMQS